MEKRILRGIRHYNESWFRSCYYHQLIAGMSYYNVPEEYVICNYTLELRKTPESVPFEYIEKDILNEEEFQALTGIRLKALESADLEECVIKSINAHKPLIVGQDSYYQPYRWDYYGKVHGSHFVLVYGYDGRKGELVIGENNYVTSFDFKEKRVPISDVKAAFEAYNKTLKKEEGFSILRLEKAEKAPLIRKTEALEKLKKAFEEKRFASYAKLYLAIPQRKWTIEELGKWERLAIILSNYFRVTIKQYETMYGSEDQKEALYEIWDESAMIKGILAKARFKKQPELVNTDKVKGYNYAAGETSGKV